MKIIEKIKEQAKLNKKRIILPESMDNRVLKAAELVIEEDIADIILIGNREEILNMNSNLIKAEIIDPKTSIFTNDYINRLFELRKDKGITLEQARELLYTNYMYFACMLVLDNKADGIVSGACHYTSDTLKPALQLIRTKENTKASAFFLMDVPNCSYGSNGVFIFADCGMQQNPTSEELAEIAYASSKSFIELVEEKPYVALLSHSTYGSANHNDVEKVIEATKIAKEKYTEYEIDGELQLDAAIDLEVAKIKAPNSNVAGHANVLIFPNLDSGNIGYKLVERLTGAKAYGPLTQGLKYPVNDLSRGCSIEDIVEVIAITVLQAQK